MKSRGGLQSDRQAPAPDRAREELVASTGVSERRVEAAGVSTAVLEAGQGPPIVLLHGQGAWAGIWLPVIARLAPDFRVIAPDLPGLGASAAGKETASVDGVLRWLDELIDTTCGAPPVLVGLSLGGSVAARFATRYEEQLAGLALVDTPGLGSRVRPAPGVLTALLRLSMRPNERNVVRLFERLTGDVQRLERALGARWTPFLQYSVALAADKHVQAANRRLMRGIGLRTIPPEQLDRITVPTALMWGEHDRVAPLRTARKASERWRWPLQVIPDAGHLASVEAPDAVAQALRTTFLGPESPDAVGGSS